MLSGRVAGVNVNVQMRPPLLVDPGEGVWPSDWFGNYTWDLPYHAVTPAPWHDTHGAVAHGFDFSLPNETTPSDVGLLTLQRSFLVLPDPPTQAANLPQVSFPTNPTFCMWVAWRYFEPVEGEYRLEALRANFPSTRMSFLH